VLRQTFGAAGDTPPSRVAREPDRHLKSDRFRADADAVFAADLTPLVLDDLPGGAA